MPRKRLNHFSQKERKEIIKELFNLLQNIKSEKDMMNILIGLLTYSEIITLSKRLQVAKMIIENKTYKEIADKTDTGPSTIKTIIGLLSRNDNLLEKELLNYFNPKKTNTKSNFKKGKLYKYPGYELAAKILGIEFINKKIQE